jgi:hypothetical protein
VRVNLIHFFQVTANESGQVSLQTKSSEDDDGSVRHQLQQPILAHNAHARVQIHKSATAKHRWTAASERDRGTIFEIHLRFEENHSNRNERTELDILNDRTLAKRENTDSNGQTKTVLFCNACDFAINANKAACRVHLPNKSHTACFKAKTISLAETERMEFFLRTYMSNNPHIRGTSIEEKTHMFRLKTVQSFLRAGQCLSTIDLQRNFLEEISGGLKLTDHSNLKSL